MAKEKTNRVVIYKLKPEILFDSLDFNEEGYTLYFSDPTRKLFVQESKISTPSWATYINTLLPSPKPSLFNKNCSFILVIAHNTSNYILCGGYGFAVLQVYIEQDFGLNIALRMIDEKEISSLNQKSMKGTTRQIIRAVSGYVPLFDRDNYNRILNTIEGKADFEGRKFRVVGKSSLALRTTRDIDHVKEVLTEIEDILSRDEKVHFPKSYTQVKDKEKVEQLEIMMLSNFQSYWRGDADRESIYLEFADPFAQFRCENFTVAYKHSKSDMADFDLDIIRELMREKGLLEIGDKEDLFKMTVSGINDAGILEIKKESVYNLIVFEGSIDSIHYIKIGKQWFQILEDVQKYIDRELANLTVHKERLPDWDTALMPEEKDYNKFVAKKNKWACLDEDFINIAGRSKIELCDLYDSDTGTFYHIKETWGCKAAYLFTQGITSAETYRQSSEFRIKCSKKWPQLFTDEIARANLVYGIAHAKAFAVDFPNEYVIFRQTKSLQRRLSSQTI